MRKITILLFMIAVLCPSLKVLAEGEGYIVKFKNEYIPTEVKSNLIESGLGNNVYLTDDVDNLYKYNSIIEYIETNETVHLIDEEINNIQCFSDDAVNTTAWQLDMVKAQYVWDLGNHGNNINIGVIDSGCNQHIDIVNNLAGGHNYILNTDDYSDNIGHGTHVTGIIAAEDNDFGITGIAPKANIYALKCFDKNYDTTVSMLAKAIYSAVDDYHCRVINMSLGLGKDIQTLHDAIEYAFAKGVIIVAAVGNDGNSTLYYPAAYDEVIGVGSIGANKEKSYFSQFNESVFVVSPGESYYSLKGTDEYVNAQGTSQATPLVSGAAAILLSAKPSISNTKFKEALENNSTDLGEPGYDTKYGYGLLDMEALFRSAIDRYYVSQITKGKIVVYNNTDTDLYATGVWTKETDNGNVCVKLDKVSISAQGNMPLECETEKVKFFLWDSLNTMRPLTIARN